jgi:hypothetical protein
MSEEITDKNEDLDLNKSPTEVTFTEEELNTLSNANPGDAGLEDVLAAHGLKFNQDVVVHVEGRPDAVYTTSENDFMTRDKAASEEWNATVGVAQGILDLESEIDEHSLAIEAEAIEHGAEKISFEEAKKIGEPPVESAGIEDPAVSAAKRVFENISLNIRLETADELRNVASRLGENETTFKTYERSFLENIANSSLRLKSTVGGFEDYPTESIHTVIRQTIHELEVPMRAGLNLLGNTLDELQNYVSFIEKKLAEQKNFAVDADENFKHSVGEENIEDVTSAVTSIEDVQSSLDEVDTLKTALKDVSEAAQVVMNAPNLRSQIYRLTDISEQMYRQPVNRAELHDELSDVVNHLTELSSNEDALNAFKAANTSVNKLLDQVNDAVRVLDPAQV